MKSKAVNSDQVTAGVRGVKDDITAGIAKDLGVGSSMANRREYLVFLAASILVSLGILALLGYIYAVQAGEVKSNAPVLTLPVSK